MQRSQLEHILRAAAGITDEPRFVVVGSQALLGQYPEAPGELIVSMEVDLFSPGNPEDTNLIEGSIGEGSPFHQTFGYYAHGVSAETAVLPAGWQDRLIPVQNRNTGEATGLCLEVHDLAVSKLVAGREKDVEFVAGLLRYGLVKPRIFEGRLEITELDVERRALCNARLSRLKSKLSER